MIMKDTTKLNSTATSNQDHVVFSLVVGTLITLVGVSLLIAPMRVLKVLAPPKYLTRQFYEIDRLALMLSLLGLSFIVLGFFILKASLL